MASNAQLVLFPGLGCDARLFAPQREAFPELIVPSWISPGKRESLQDYARRYAGVVASEHPGPMILGGVSLGGMVAYEMARHLRPKAVVQIASCRSQRAFRATWRAGRHLLPWLPLQTWSVAKGLAPSVVKATRFLAARDRTLTVTMFREMDSGFMHWALQALLAWNPTKLEGVPVFQIHGRRDWLLPARWVEADRYIPDGGHMINLTHATEVNAFIAEAIAKGGES